MAMENLIGKGGLISIAMLVYWRVWFYIHQTFQVPKMEVLTYISCMDTAYARDFTHPQNSRL